jgi:hypothetical protein
MGDDLAGIAARLAHRHGLANFAAIGAGVESQVLAADSGTWGRVALKLPLRDSSYVSLNDPGRTVS